MQFRKVQKIAPQKECLAPPPPCAPNPRCGLVQLHAMCSRAPPTTRTESHRAAVQKIAPQKECLAPPPPCAPNPRCGLVQLHAMCSRAPPTTRTESHRAARPAPAAAQQSGASSPPLFLATSWRRRVDACRGGERAAGEGEDPVLLGPPAGRMGQDRKSLPPTYTGRRHFVPVCIPG